MQSPHVRLICPSLEAARQSCLFLSRINLKHKMHKLITPMWPYLWAGHLNPSASIFFFFAFTGNTKSFAGHFRATRELKLVSFYMRTTDVVCNLYLERRLSHGCLLVQSLALPRCWAHLCPTICMSPVYSRSAKRSRWDLTCFPFSDWLQDELERWLCP